MRAHEEAQSEMWDRVGTDSAPIPRCPHCGWRRFNQDDGAKQCDGCGAVFVEVTLHRDILEDGTIPR